MSRCVYVPISTQAMIRAAELWAAARRGGYATTTDERIDADVILAAQVDTFPAEGAEVVVATMNVRHLSRFVTAKHWLDV